MRSRLPTSLFGRALLIVVLPLLLLQIVVAVVFIQRHYEGVTAQMARSVAAEMRLVIAQVQGASTPFEAQERLAAVAAPLDLSLGLADRPMPAADRRHWWDLSGRALGRTLRAEVDRPLHVDLVSNPRLVRIEVMLEAGRLTAILSRRRVAASNPHQLLVLMAATAVLLACVAIVFLRNQVRPIEGLARAAEAFGKGRPFAYKPRGAEEVRRAGAAFLAMRGRIERHIDQRTKMLAGVSHDLRTPLTRLKLSLALLPEGGPEAEAMARDVAEMEATLDSFLAYARGDALEETSDVDPAALAASVLDGAARLGAPTELVTDGADGAVPLRATTLRRALVNLVDNAARFGSKVRLSVSRAPRSLTFAVEDDGPGIPEAFREEAMRPFAKLDPARSAARGVGLGLAIAEDAARAHGGTLRLEASADLGGARAVIRVPI